MCGEAPAQGKRPVAGPWFASQAQERQSTQLPSKARSPVTGALLRPSPKASDPGAGLTAAGGSISWEGSEQQKVPPICFGSSPGAEERAAGESEGADRPQEGVAKSYQLREPRQTPLPTSWFSGLCPQGHVPNPES